MNPNPSPATRFSKGETGNPNGRPKGSISLAELVKKELELVPKGEKKSFAELLIAKVMDMALKGNFQAIKLIWSYVDGLPRQTIETNEETPLLILDDLRETIQKVYGGDERVS